MHQRSNRRDFLKQAGLAGLGFWVAGGLARAEDSSPNEKLSIACIGVDGIADTHDNTNTGSSTSRGDRARSRWP